MSPAPPRRKGASRIADIPPAVLRDLNAGRIETVTLVEWLAIDLVTLVSHAAAETGLARHRDTLVAAARGVADEGVQRRFKAMGAAILGVAGSAGRTFERVANHRSDAVRVLAAYAVGADDSLPLDVRLEAMRRFATDRAMSVRECAWDSFRPYVAADLERGITLLRPWVDDADANVRRCAVEATRPRGVWTLHIGRLKRDPSPGLALLEPVRADASDYVRRSVGNWINDASKSRPDWARDLCRRWTRESKCAETAWIVKHALRTLTSAMPTPEPQDR